MIFNLSSLLDDLGEDDVTTLFSGYRAAKDSSVDEFLMGMAVMMEKEQDRRLRTSDPVTLNGRYLIQFVGQMLQAEIKAVLREKDMDSKYTSGSILATLSTLDVLEYDGRRGLSEITKNVRQILELFGIYVPETPIYHESILDTADLLEPVPEGEHFVG